MTLTCHHFCPLTLENTLQAITGRIPPAGTHICHYTPSWVMSESCGFHGFHHLPLKPLQANCCLKTQKKNNQKSKNPSMSISIKVVGIPQFLAPLAFLARKAPKKSRCSQSSNCRLLDLVEAKTAVCTSWPKYATVLKILPVQTQGQVSNMSNMSVHCYTYI